MTLLLLGRYVDALARVEHVCWTADEILTTEAEHQRVCAEMAHLVDAHLLPPGAPLVPRGGRRGAAAAMLRQVRRRNQTPDAREAEYVALSAHARHLLDVAEDPSWIRARRLRCADMAHRLYVTDLQDIVAAAAMAAEEADGDRPLALGHWAARRVEVLAPRG